LSGFDHRSNWVENFFTQTKIIIITRSYQKIVHIKINKKRKHKKIKINEIKI